MPTTPNPSYLVLRSPQMHMRCLYEPWKTYRTCAGHPGHPAIEITSLACNDHCRCESDMLVHCDAIENTECSRDRVTKACRCAEEDGFVDLKGWKGCGVPCECAQD